MTSSLFTLIMFTRYINFTLCKKSFGFYFVRLKKSYRSPTGITCSNITSQVKNCIGYLMTFIVSEISKFKKFGFNVAITSGTNCFWEIKLTDASLCSCNRRLQNVIQMPQKLCNIYSQTHLCTH